MTRLPTRQLGRDGPFVTPIGLGLMGLSVAYGPALPDEQRLAFLDAAYELGEWFWDTSDFYGDSELLIGQWIKLNPEKRKDLFIATKFGAATSNSSPQEARRVADEALKRLNIDVIDLFYVHRLDGKTPIEKTIRGMVELKNEGKIRYLGLSECSAESLRRASEVHHIAAAQMEYSPFALEIEAEQYNLLTTARQLGTAIVAYSPIGRGILTGTIRSPADFPEGDFRRLVPRYSEENFPKNLVLVDAIGELARKKGCTASQLTLAWLMAQSGEGSNIFPIPGTTKVARLEENIGSLNVELTDQEDKAIRKLSEEAGTVGERYPESMGGVLFADTPQEVS